MCPHSDTQAFALTRLDELRSADRNRISGQTQRVLASIHRDVFDCNLSVKTLKARCGLRDNNISCRFKCETGFYLHAYITSLRLEAATSLLRREDLSVVEIAQQVGYRHLQTFYRVFKRFAGCTPGAFRARYCTGVRPLAAYAAPAIQLE